MILDYTLNEHRDGRKTAYWYNNIMNITKNLIEEYWPLSQVKIENKFNQIDNVERKVGFIASKQGKFIYKIADPYKTQKALNNDLKVFPLLAEKGFTHIPKLLRTKDNNNYLQKDGKFIYILEYIEGTHPQEDPKNYKKLGEIMAELHNIQNYPYNTEFSANYVIHHDLQDIARKFPFRKEYLELVKQQPNYDQFPRTLIHTDIGPGNAIVKSDGEIILIDWDDAGVGTTILDLGYPLIQQFVSEDLEFKEENAKAFYGSYFSKRIISDLEKNHIFDAALFFSLMYIVYGNTEKRWNRIQWALKNRVKLTKVYDN
jgi:Ser/Thr protein kinase RdoA (MazF antagonist)